MNNVYKLLEEHYLKTLDNEEYVGGITKNEKGEDTSVGHSGIIKLNNKIFPIPSGTVISEFIKNHS